MEMKRKLEEKPFRNTSLKDDQQITFSMDIIAEGMERRPLVEESII